ncbi:hypothetical protein DXZ20_06115 [Leptolyngbyaceae cyanobacterium CCMR0081]|uniref:Uncharacterized protein n=2 Tax=Adonisia TaxID=2950183 RepID=A0A6M0RGA3_9CYAN|nr:hypothetical protein [Adonisia turfae CCMR0081]
MVKISCFIEHNRLAKVRGMDNLANLPESIMVGLLVLLQSLIERNAIAQLATARMVVGITALAQVLLKFVVLFL